MSNLMGIPIANAGDESEHPIFGGLTTAESSFGRIYENAKRADVRAMMRLATREERRAEAKRMLSILDPPQLDREIDIEGGTGGEPAGSAHAVMVAREGDGLRWVPSVTLESLALPFAAVEYDRGPYKLEAKPSPTALLVSIRPQDFPPAADLQAKPRPFSPWPRINADGKGGVGSTYPSLNQADDDGYESTWQDFATGAVYEKIFRAMGSRDAGGALLLYSEWVRIK